MCYTNKFALPCLTLRKKFCHIIYILLVIQGKNEPSNNQYNVPCTWKTRWFLKVLRCFRLDFFQLGVKYKACSYTKWKLCPEKATLSNDGWTTLFFICCFCYVFMLKIFFQIHQRDENKRLNKFSLADVFCTDSQRRL